MDYYGLTNKYRVDRPLSEQEIELQLKQNKKLAGDPIYQLSVIRINSTYLECTDKFYAWKGFLTISTTLPILMFSWLLMSMTIVSAGRILSMNIESLTKELAALGFMYLLVGTAIALFIWFLRKESFRHTHYPIRFNRKNRMVYVFRLDGTVLAVPWDEVFFTLCPAQMRGVWEVRGHVLAEDQNTVKETFVLSYYGQLSKTELACTGTKIEESDHVRRHWEFVRRYMEEGPKNLISKVDFVMPIGERRESFWHGFHRMMAEFAPIGWFAYIFAPLIVLVAVARWVSMRTCKIPRWPDDVEAACAVTLEDRYTKG